VSGVEVTGDPAAFEEHLPPSLRGSMPVREFFAELVWAFRHPRPWLEGLACNLVLSVLYLFWEPLAHEHDRPPSVILVGSYFATFVLADVTSTNILGHDRIRTRRSLNRGVTIRTLILRRNFVLLVVVGLPVLIATAILTVQTREGSYRLAVTLPGVAFPIFTWIGVGNIVSVLLPVAYLPLKVRWRLRYRRGWVGRWLAHLVLPYLLWYAVEPLADWPLRVMRHARVGGYEPLGVRGAIIAALGLAFWLSGTWVAVRIVRRRGLVIH
jgi:hypothetical protein